MSANREFDVEKRMKKRTVTLLSVPTFWASWLGKCDVLRGTRESDVCVEVGMTTAPRLQDALLTITKYPALGDSMLNVRYLTHEKLFSCFA